MIFLCPFPKHAWMIGIDLGMLLSNTEQREGKSPKGILFTLWQLNVTSTHPYYSKVMTYKLIRGQMELFLYGITGSYKKQVKVKQLNDVHAWSGKLETS